MAAAAGVGTGAPLPTGAAVGELPELPVEVWTKIIGMLSVANLCRLARVSRQMRQLVNDNILWRDQCMNQWNLGPMEGRQFQYIYKVIYRRIRRHWPKGLARRIETAGHVGQGDNAGQMRSIWWVAADEFRVISTCLTGEVGIWDSRTGESLHRLKHHTKKINTGDYNAATGVLVTASTDQSLQLYNAKRGEHMFSLKGHTGSILNCKLSPDAQRVLSASHDRTATLWDTTTGASIRSYAHERAVLQIDFIDENTHVTGCYDGSVKIWDLRSADAAATYRPHPQDITSMCIAADEGADRATDALILTGNYDGQVAVYDIRAAAVRQLPPHTFTVRTMLPLSKRFMLSGSHDGIVRVYDMVSNTNAASTKATDGWVRSVLRVPNSRLVMSCGANDGTAALHLLEGPLLGGNERNVKLRSIKTFAGVAEEPATAMAVTSSLFVTGTLSGRLTIFDLKAINEEDPLSDDEDRQRPASAWCW